MSNLILVIVATLSVAFLLFIIGLAIGVLKLSASQKETTRRARGRSNGIDFCQGLSMDPETGEVSAEHRPSSIALN